MTKEQHDFFAMLDNYQRISKFWNREKLSLDIPELKQELNQLSSGERHMANFFASVWLDESESFPFDILDSLKTTDSKAQSVILKWLIDPFFP